MHTLEQRNSPPNRLVLSVDELRRRLGDLHPLQIQAWRQMTPASKLDIAFQAYQFALDAVRITEEQKWPTLSLTELQWRITRRMQGDLRLGKNYGIR